MPDQSNMFGDESDGFSECAKYNPLGPSKPSILYGMEIQLSTEDITNWFIKVYYPKHFTDGELLTFGSARIEPDTLRMGGFTSFYEITPTRFEYLDTEDDPCVTQKEKDEIEKVDLWNCIEQNHIASKLNCTLPWLSDDKRPLCAEPGEYNAYNKLYQDVMDFDTDMVNKIGGCTPKCLRDEYSVRHYQTTTSGEPDSWTVNLYFGKDRFYQRQQGLH